MQGLKRFLYLPTQQRWLIFQVAVAILVVRLSLILFPLRTVRFFALSISWRSREIPSAHCIAGAIGSVARFVPGTTCLVQALAAHALLIRHGYGPHLTIGVAKDECHQFEAHAWVTCENQVVIGDLRKENYSALLSLGPLL